MILDESPPKLLKTGFIVISGTFYDMYLNVSLQSMPSFPIHSTTFKDCMFQPFHPNPSPGHPGITSWSLGMTQIKSFEMHLHWQILPPASLVAVELLNYPFHILAAHHSGASSGPILWRAGKFTKTKNSDGANLFA